MFLMSPSSLAADTPLHLRLARAVGRQAEVEDFSVAQAQRIAPSHFQTVPAPQAFY